MPVKTKDLPRTFDEIKIKFEEKKSLNLNPFHPMFLCSQEMVDTQTYFIQYNFFRQYNLFSVKKISSI